MAEERKRELAVNGDRSPARPQGERRLLWDALRAVGQVAGVAARTAEWAAETAVEASRQMVGAVVPPDDSARLEAAMRQVVSYVPVEQSVNEPGVSARGPAELRQRGDALLARSADVYFTEEVHPAFDHMLDELAPDEARILRFLAQSGPQPSVDVRTFRPLGIGSELVAGNLTSVPEQSGVRHLDRSSSYLINLKRLGLVEISDDPVVLSRYMVLEVQPNVDAAMKQAGRSPKVIRKSLVLTDFGREFCAACFTLESRHEAN